MDVSAFDLGYVLMSVCLCARQSESPHAYVCHYAPLSIGLCENVCALKWMGLSVCVFCCPFCLSFDVDEQTSIQLPLPGPGLRNLHRGMLMHKQTNAKHT